MSSELEVFEFFDKKFKLIYGDLVAVTAKKPLEISFEVEAVLAHLAVAKLAKDSETIQSNLGKAHGHLQRACLDAAKMLWIELKQRVETITSDELKRKWCGTVSEGKLLQMYQNGNMLAREARRSELSNVGIAPERSIDNYYNAANEFQNFLDSIDWERVSSIKKLRFIYILKSQTAGLIVGLLAGIVSSSVVAVAAWRYLPNQPPAITTPALSAPASNSSPNELAVPKKGS